MQWPIQMAESGGEGVSGSGASGSGEAGTGAEAQGQGQGSGESLLAGNSMLDYRSTFPETLRSAPIIQRHDTIEALAKTVVEQESMLGRALFLPKDAPDTDAYRSGMQKIYDKLGRPEKPDAYTLAAPEGRELGEEISGRFQRSFHKAGLSQAQVDEVMGEYWRTVEYAENVKQGREVESYQEGRNALFAEFGASAEAEIMLASKFVQHFGAGAFSGEAGGKAWEQITQARLPDGSMLKNSPYLVATFAEAMRRMGEGEFVESAHYVPGQDTMKNMETRFGALQTKRMNGTLTPEEATEHTQLRNQLSVARERAQHGGRRVA